MSTFKTQALVLHKRVLKNADRLYILYTPEHGKVEAKVRSAAKSSSKLAGHLEPFCISAVMIARGESLETIAGAYLQKSFIFKDLKTRALALVAAEIVNKFIMPIPFFYGVVSILGPTLGHHFPLSVVKNIPGQPHLRLTVLVYGTRFPISVKGMFVGKNLVLYFFFSPLGGLIFRVGRINANY